MKVLPIRLLGDPILRTPAEPVKRVTRRIRELATSMVETMLNAEGVGLAAPQVGESLRLFVLNLRFLTPEDGRIAQVLLNPKLIFVEGESEEEEGCLSIPGLFYELKRPQRVVIEALELTDEGAKKVEVEAEGLHARAILHEIDHLEGILFIDRLDMLTRASLIADWEKSRKTRTG